jgi:uncharacterized protein (TIGR04141 family)
MSDSNKIPVTIYEIEREQFEKLDADDTMGEIVRQLEVDGTNLTKINLANQDFGEFSVSLFSFSKFYPPTWLKFLTPIIHKDDPISKSRNRIFSFIGFIAYKKRIYAIAGGYGSFEIEQFTKSDFGLEIIVKLFEPDNRVIKSIQQRGVTGIVLGQTRYYRGDQRFSDENQFGQIFKQVQAELDKHHLVHSFGFSKEGLRKESAGCLAKSSFKINKAIDFDELLNLIKKIDNILGRPSKFTLNKVLHLRGKRFEDLVEELSDEMYKQVFNDYKAGIEPDFEICHSKFEQYLTAEKYILELSSKEFGKYDDRPGWSQIIIDIKNKKFLEDKDYVDFKHSVLLRKMASYDASNTRVTYDTVFDHMNGELIHKGNSYFHIDKGWYRIDPTFIDDLNRQCTSMLNNDVWDTTTITQKFDITQDEKIFNQSYLNKPGALVLDTITPENIECCDILLYNNDRICFVHVKKGFNNTMRDLAAQVSIAAKRIRETVHSNFKYLEKVETMAKTSVKKDTLRNAIAAQKFPPNGLVKLFKQSPRPRISFCLAFVDSANNSRSLLTNITKFESNIAKYSLIELSQDLRLMGFDFKVVQIEK